MPTCAGVWPPPAGAWRSASARSSAHLSRASLPALLAQLAGHGAGAAWLARRYPGEFPAPGAPALIRHCARCALTSGVALITRTTAGRCRRRDRAAGDARLRSGTPPLQPPPSHAAAALRCGHDGAAGLGSGLHPQPAAAAGAPARRPARPDPRHRSLRGRRGRQRLGSRDWRDAGPRADPGWAGASRRARSDSGRARPRTQPRLAPGNRRAGRVHRRRLRADPGLAGRAGGGAAQAPGAILQGATRPAPDELHRAGLLSHTQRIEALGPQYETCNIAYPRVVLEALGGFDERFGLEPAGEDTDLAWRAIAAGHPTVFAADALVHHAVEPIGVMGMLRRAARWSAVVRVFSDHPETRAMLYHGRFWNVWHYLVYRSMLVAGRADVAAAAVDHAPPAGAATPRPSGRRRPRCGRVPARSRCRRMLGRGPRGDPSPHAGSVTLASSWPRERSCGRSCAGTDEDRPQPRPAPPRAACAAGFSRRRPRAGW